MKKFLVFALLLAFILPANAQRYNAQQRQLYSDFLSSVRRCDLSAIKDAVYGNMPLNLNTADEKYDTPLIIAISGNCLKGAWMLFNAGAKPMPNKTTLVSPLNLIMDKYSSTAPGDWADFVSKLLEAGANANFQNTYGENSLILAVKNDKAYYVEILLYESNVRFDLADNDGRTALHWAAYYNYGDIAQLLLDAGANPNKKDKEGLTPLQLARRMHNTYVAQIIEDFTGYTF